MSLLTLVALCMHGCFWTAQQGRAQHSINLMVPMSCPCSVQHGRALLQKCQVDPPSEKYIFLYAIPEAMSNKIILSR